jgi:hypothetical protein
MENINNVVNEEIKEDVKVDTVEVKTFTQEEVNEMISKRLQRERKDIEAKIEAERKEAEELAKLSEQEKQKKLFEKQVKEFEETKRAFENERLLNETSKQLASKNLPIEFAEMLKGNDAESTFENIKLFEAKFNESVEKVVTERLRGNVPKTTTTPNIASITKEQFNKMGYNSRVELKKNNPEQYSQLMKG